VVRAVRSAGVEPAKRYERWGTGAPVYIFMTLGAFMAAYEAHHRAQAQACKTRMHPDGGNRKVIGWEVRARTTSPAWPMKRSSKMTSEHRQRLP
jgi:hypothetical protein